MRETKQRENFYSTKISFHEIRQELIEQIYKWNQQNEELHPEAKVLQEMARQIENYQSDSDYWAIRNLSKKRMIRKTRLYQQRNPEKLAAFRT